MTRVTSSRRAALVVGASLVLTLSACDAPDAAVVVTEQDGPFDPLAIELTGLPPGEDVTLTSTTVVTGVPFAAKAMFTVPDDGVVDLARTAPTSGDWDVADPAAPLWALTSEVSTWSAAWEPPFDLSLTVAAADGEELAAATVERPGSAPGVETRSVDDGVLFGEYAVPADLEVGERRPALLVFGGSEGGLGAGAQIARRLAGLGYPALAISYFGSRGQPDVLEEVPVEPFFAGLDWLQEQPEVDTGRVATFGVSRGGEIALWLAAEHPELVHAAIAPVGSGRLVCAVTDDATAAWTLDGRPLTPECQSFGASVDAALIDVRAIEGPVVLACGGRDELWPSCRYADEIVERRGDGPTVLVRGEKAGHVVAEAPYTPAFLGPDVFEGFGVTSSALPDATHQVRVDFWTEVVATLDGLRRSP